MKGFLQQTKNRKPSAIRHLQFFRSWSHYELPSKKCHTPFDRLPLIGYEQIYWGIFRVCEPSNLGCVCWVKSRVQIVTSPPPKKTSKHESVWWTFHMIEFPFPFFMLKLEVEQRKQKELRTNQRLVQQFGTKFSSCPHFNLQKSCAQCYLQ